MKAVSFSPFPFPALEEGELEQRIRPIGERLIAKEKLIHDQGLVTVLRQIHDQLDEAASEAYGWGDLQKEGGTGVSPVSSPDIHRQDACAPFEEALLTRLIALNHERAHGHGRLEKCSASEHHATSNA